MGFSSWCLWCAAFRGPGLLDLADRLRSKLGDAAIVLGAAADGDVDLAVDVAKLPDAISAARDAISAALG